MKRILLLPLILIIGCYSPKKAEKQLDKAKDKYPALVAQKTSNWFPCKEVEIKTDSSAYKKWLASLDSLFNRGTDTVVIVDSFETISTDCSKYKENLIAISSLLNKANHTIRLIRNKTINPPAIHDTIIKLDSTQIVILTDKLNTSEKERQNQESKRNFWFKFGISFLIAFLISLIFNILKHTKW